MIQITKSTLNDASGYIHIKTDLWTVHHYERPEKLLEYLLPDTVDGVFHRWPDQEVKYAGQPYLNDEFGGLKWICKNRNPFADNTWGYGSDIQTEEKFYAILKEEVDIMLNIKNMCGYCYTQLTDVEQEENGIYNYDRSEKFDMKKQSPQEITIDNIMYNDINGFKHSQKKVILCIEEPLDSE